MISTPAADALDQIVVGVVLLEVLVEFPLLAHVHLAQAQILHGDQVRLVEMRVVVCDAAPLLHRIEEVQLGDSNCSESSVSL